MCLGTRGRGMEGRRREEEGGGGTTLFCGQEEGKNNFHMLDRIILSNI